MRRLRIRGTLFAALSLLLSICSALAEEYTVDDGPLQYKVWFYTGDATSSSRAVFSVTNLLDSPQELRFQERQDMPEFQYLTTSSAAKVLSVAGFVMGIPCQTKGWGPLCTPPWQYEWKGLSLKPHDTIRWTLQLEEMAPALLGLGVETIDFNFPSLSPYREKYIAGSLPPRFTISGVRFKRTELRSAESWNELFRQIAGHRLFFYQRALDPSFPNHEEIWELALYNRNPVARLSALSALGFRIIEPDPGLVRELYPRWSEPKWQKHLEHALHDKESRAVRQLALEIAAVIPDQTPELLDLWTERVMDDDSAVSYDAFRHLRALSEKSPESASAVRKYVIRSLESTNEEVRTRAVDLLAPYNDPAAIEPLARLYTRFPKDSIATVLIIHVRQNPTYAWALVPLLRSDSRQVRLFATETLAKLGDKDAVALLRKALHSPDIETRRQATHAMSEVKDLDSIPVLITALKDSDSSIRRGSELALSNMAWREWHWVDKGKPMTIEAAPSRVTAGIAYFRNAKGKEVAIPFEQLDPKDRESIIWWNSPDNDIFPREEWERQKAIWKQQHEERFGKRGSRR